MPSSEKRSSTPMSEQEQQAKEDFEKISGEELADAAVEILEASERGAVIEQQMEESREVSDEVVATADAIEEGAAERDASLTTVEQLQNNAYVIDAMRSQIWELTNQAKYAHGMNAQEIEKRVLALEKEISDKEVRGVELEKESVEGAAEDATVVTAERDPMDFAIDVVEPEGREDGGKATDEEGVAGESGEKIHEFLSDATVKDLEKRLGTVGFEGDIKELIGKYGENTELHVLNIEVKHYRDEMTGLEAQMKKYEGLAGGLRKMFNKGKFESAEAVLAEMRSVYETVRAEYVGGKAEKMMTERMALEEARLEKLGKEKGLGDHIKGAYKAMGDANLAAVYDKLGRDKGGKIKTMMLKAASVRTLIGASLVGGSFLVGGAAGLGMFAASRGMRGIGSSIMAYDSMRGIANRERVLSVQTRLAETKVGEKMGITKESAELAEREVMEKMTDQEIIEYLDAAEARALTGGRKLSEDETYQKMSAFFAQRMEQHKEQITEGEDDESAAKIEAAMMTNLNEMMRDSDKRQEEIVAKRESNKRAMKIAAVGLGMIMGTIGAGGKVEAYQAAKEAVVMDAFEEKSQATIAAAVTDAAEQKSFAAEAAVLIEAQKSSADVFQELYGEKGEAMLEAARVDKGEGITHVIRDQLKLNAEGFGYDPKVHGGLDRWATLKSAEIARGNGMLSATSELRFEGVDPSDPDQFAFLTKTPDGEFKIAIEGLETKVFNRPIELNFGGGDAGEWSAHIEYGRNGLPKGFSFETSKLPSKDVLAEAFLNNEELADRLANRGNIATLLNSESGEMYQKWFSRVHQEQELLDKLRSMGQGGSRAAKMLEDSVDRKLEILNRASEGMGELVHFESADAGANIKAYMEVFGEKGIHRQSFERLVYSKEGVARISMVDSVGESSITVERSTQSIEAAWRHLRTIRENIEMKSGLDFTYGDEGAVAGFERSGLLRMDKAVDELRLKPGFLNILKEEGLSNGERNRVDMLVRVIATEESAIRKLMETGLTDVPERSFLETDIVGKHRELKALIGDAEVWRQATQEQIENTAKFIRSLSLKTGLKPSVFDVRASLTDAAEVTGGSSVAERTEILVASKLSPETLQQIATGEFNDGLVEVAPTGEVVVLDTTDPSTVEAAKAALEARSSAAESAESLAEVTAEQTEVPASVPGVFERSPGGGVRHILSNADIEAIPVSKVEETVLQEGWREKVTGPMGSMHERVILNRARIIAVRQETLVQLEEAGLSDSPEAGAVRRGIAMSTRLTERRYGDVFQ